MSCSSLMLKSLRLTIFHASMPVPSLVRLPRSGVANSPRLLRCLHRLKDEDRSMQPVYLLGKRVIPNDVLEAKSRIGPTSLTPLDTRRIALRQAKGLFAQVKGSLKLEKKNDFFTDLLLMEQKHLEACHKSVQKEKNQRLPKFFTEDEQDSVADTDPAVEQATDKTGAEGNAVDETATKENATEENDAHETGA
ncbi:hypothetical protein L3X38_032279 [Prunus dulcis]|uniref:Uncharacterized protein n=1 Tax=Prunus dulcis TaxID=3755 RepID=A0AAD4VG10_PRUDU|nr:hypothetical protein L3X38_032279 [Prunus dulcis]